MAVGVGVTVKLNDPADAENDRVVDAETNIASAVRPHARHGITPTASAEINLAIRRPGLPRRDAGTRGTRVPRRSGVVSSR